jgi:hypothetical protein
MKARHRGSAAVAGQSRKAAEVDPSGVVYLEVKVRVPIRPTADGPAASTRNASSDVPMTGKSSAMGAEIDTYHLKKWWFCLGGIILYLFVVQVATGIALSFITCRPDRVYAKARHDHGKCRWYIRSLHMVGQ